MDEEGLREEEVEAVVVVGLLAPCANSKSLLFPKSLTHRFPDLSKATPSGFIIVDWVAGPRPALET